MANAAAGKVVTTSLAKKPAAPPLAGTTKPTTQTASYVDNSGNKQTGYVSTPTTYKDALGQNQTGYIIDGTTYKDALGTQRIDTGSIVSTAGGEYILTPDGSMKYSDYLAQQSNPSYGSSTTTYIDSNGRAQTGYIINGVTYNDPAGTQRISNGSIVPTAGGDYILTDSGSMLYSDYLKQVEAQQAQAQAQADLKIQEEMLANLQAQYAAQLAAGERAAAAQTQQAIAQLESQRGQLNASYDDLNRQLYIDLRQNEKSIPQQLAAMGYTGGLTESSLLGLQTSYEEALRSNEQGRYEGNLNIDLGVTNAQLEAMIAQARMEQELASQYQVNYANVMAQMQEQQNYANEQSQNQMSYERALQLQKAEQLAAYGDYSGYLALGYTPQQVIAMSSANQPAAAPTSAGDSPIKKDPVPLKRTYNDIVSELANYRASGWPAAGLNEYINAAVAEGIITTNEARLLRSSYVGSSR